MAGDAGDERAEDQRRDDDLDEAEEDVAQEAQMLGHGGAVEADFAAEKHRYENPIGESAAAEAVSGKSGEAEPAKDGEPNLGVRMRAKGDRQSCAGSEEEETGKEQSVPNGGARFWI